MQIEKIKRALYTNGPVKKINEIIDALNDLTDNTASKSVVNELSVFINNQLDGLREAIETNRHNIAGNKNNIDANTDAIADLDVVVGNDNSGLIKQVNTNTTDIAALKQTVATHTNQITEAAQDIVALQEAAEQIDINTEDIAALKAKTNAHDTTLADHTARIATNEADIAELKGANDNLKEYIDRSDFINMAPKIGYYQEDKIQAISTYEISNVPMLEKNAPVFTSDNVGREIMYYIGNGGGADANATTGLRKAYRVNDTANWIWYNQDIVPACFKDAEIRINRIFGCDNTYLLCMMTDKSFHLIHTNYSFDESDWKTEDDVSSMITDISTDEFIHAKYLEDYDTFITFNSISSALGVEKWYRVRVWRYSTQELLRQDDITGLSPYVEMCNGYSFLPTREVHNILTELTDEEVTRYGKFTVNISSSETTFACNITLLEEQETLVICRYGMQFNAYNVATGVRKWKSCSYIPVTYHFPLSVARGENEGEITCNLRRSDIILGDSSPFIVSLVAAKIGAGRSWLLGSGITNSSYDTLRGYIYRTGRSYSTPKLYMSRSLQDVIDPDDARYNCLKMNYTSEYYTPDASYWGKFFRLGLAMWDNIFLSCANSDGNWLVWVKDWRLTKGHENDLVIEPVPGTYVAVDSAKITNVLTEVYNASVYTFTTQHPRKYTDSFALYKGFTSVRMPDGSARYFKAEYSDHQIRGREFLKKETYTDTGEMESFELEKQELSPIQIEIPPSAFNTGDSEHTFIFGSHVIYNPMANMYFVFGVLDYGDRATNDNIARDHIVGIRANGSIVTFGEPKDHPWPFSDAKLNNYDTTYQTPWLPSGSNWIDAYTLQVFFTEYHNGGRSTRNVTFRFNEGYSNYEVLDTRSINGGIFWMGTTKTPDALVSHCLIYSGPKYGFCGQGETKSPNSYTDNYKINIRTQNAMFGTQETEKNYTDEEMIPGFLGAGINTYTMYNCSASGLICYVPSIPIFLGGYYSEIVNAIPVILEPNLNKDTPGSFDGHRDANYVYLERDPADRTKIIAYAKPIKIIDEGAAMFNKILVAKVETDDEKAIESVFYTINTGYNSWKFHRDNS